MTIKPTGSLAGLISVKGNAVAAVPTKPEPYTPPPQPIAAPLPEKSQPKGGQSYWKAMTVKLGRDQYVSLKIHGAKLNKTSQDCISEAIDLWLAAQNAE